MKAFDIVGTTITFTPEFLAIPEFKAIWDADKTKIKSKATKELSYVVFLCDERAHNPYVGYSVELREEVLNIDFFGEEDPKIPKLVQGAITKFKSLLETTSTRLLRSGQSAADKLAGWFDSIDFTLVDDKGQFIYSASELSRNLKEIGNIIKSLKQLEQQVRLEQMDDNIARGGAEIGMFEIPT